MLKDKVAIVPGASRGIGKAIALEMARNGANVAIIYAGNTNKAEEAKREVEEFGVKANIYKCDVANFEEATEFAKTCGVRELTVLKNGKFDSIGI